MHRGTVHQTP